MTEYLDKVCKHLLSKVGEDIDLGDGCVVRLCGFNPETRIAKRDWLSIELRIEINPAGPSIKEQFWIKLAYGKENTITYLDGKWVPENVYMDTANDDKGYWCATAAFRQMEETAAPVSREAESESTTAPITKEPSSEDVSTSKPPTIVELENERLALSERSEAWLSICRLLDELCPQWWSLNTSGTENAFDAIRTLAANQQKPLQWERRKPTEEECETRWLASLRYKSIYVPGDSYPMDWEEYEQICILPDILPAAEPPKTVVERLWCFENRPGSHDVEWFSEDYRPASNVVGTWHRTETTRERVVE